MKTEYCVYENLAKNAPPKKRFFCLPFFLLDGEMELTTFTYGTDAEAAESKAREFWEAEIAKARANRAKGGAGASGKGRPQNSKVTPAMLDKIDNFDPKG